MPIIRWEGSWRHTHTFLPVFDQTHTPQQTYSSQQQLLGSREGLYTIFGLDFIFLRLYNLIYIETEGKNDKLTQEPIFVFRLKMQSLLISVSCPRVKLAGNNKQMS